MKINFLYWDSIFFNLKIGRFYLSNDSQQYLTELVSMAKDEGYDLIYIYTGFDQMQSFFFRNERIHFIDTQINLIMKVPFDIKKCKYEPIL